MKRKLLSREYMQKSLMELQARFGLIELVNVCQDPTCECKQQIPGDLQKYNGKYVATVTATLDSIPVGAPIVRGPFETEDEARTALEKLVDDVSKALKELGVDLKLSRHGDMVESVKEETPLPFAAKRL